MNFLKGYKTYIIAAGAIITALGAYLNNSISVTELVSAIIAALTAMTLRAGITNDVAKLKSIVVAALLAAGVIATGCSLTSCANFQQNAQTVLGPPSQVQADITYLGGRAKQYINAQNQAKIHNFAEQLSTTANADLTPLFALLPTSTGSVTGDLLVATLKTTLQFVVVKWSGNNQTLLSYFHAVANGLLANY